MVVVLASLFNGIILGPFNESINFGIPMLIVKVEAVKCGPNVELNMLLKKPASQLIKYTHNDPIIHLQIFLWVLINQGVCAFSGVSYDLISYLGMFSAARHMG